VLGWRDYVLIKNMIENYKIDDEYMHDPLKHPKWSALL